MELILISDIMLLAIAVIALVVACITDIKRQEVANWLNFSLLAVAFAIRAIAATLSLQFSYFLYAILAFILFFILANVLYYGKFFGGGDAKLLIALATVFATSPSFTGLIVPSIIKEPFLFSFLINIFVIGSLYSLIFMTFFAIKYRKSFIPEFKKIYRKAKIVRMGFLITSLIFLMFSFFFSIFIFMFLITLIFPYLYIVAKATENSSMIKTVPPSKLTEGDWLVHTVKLKSKTIRPNVHGLSSQDIATLKKAKKKVLIKYGIPFVPVFLISLIVTLLLSNLMILVLKAFFF